MKTAPSRSISVLSLLTYARMASVPVVMGLILVGSSGSYAFGLAAALFTLAAATDWLDGYLARRWDRATSLGSFLDTTADKLLVSGALIGLVAVGRASPWIAMIIIGRELVILGLRAAVAVADGFAVKPSIWGKLKAGAQFVAIVLAILRPDIDLNGVYLDEVAMSFAAAITLMSALDYLARFSSVFTSGGGSR